MKRIYSRQKWNKVKKAGHSSWQARIAQCQSKEGTHHVSDMIYIAAVAIS